MDELETTNQKALKLMLIHACEEDDLTEVNRLIAAGALMDWRAMTMAAWYGHIDIVNALIAAKCPINKDTITWALNSEYTEIVQLLTEYKDQKNER